MCVHAYGFVSLESLVHEQSGIHPDTMRFKHKGKMLLGDQQLCDFNLPPNPVLDLEVHFLIDVQVEQPGRATYVKRSKELWGGSKLLTPTTAHSSMFIRASNVRAALYTCTKCGVERRQTLHYTNYMRSLLLAAKVRACVPSLSRIKV